MSLLDVSPAFLNMNCIWITGELHLSIPPIDNELSLCYCYEGWEKYLE